jgi:PAS domain-containing protein
MLEHETAGSELGLDPVSLFQAAPEALFVLGADRIALVNERMVHLLGWDPTGMYVREAFPDWRAPTEDQTPFAATLRMEQGYDLPVQVRINPSTNGDHSIVAVRDARALLAGREAETRLAEAKAK